MGSAAERLLRLATLTREPAADYSLGLLKDMARTEPAAQRLQVRVEKGRWSAEAAQIDTRLTPTVSFESLLAIPPKL